MNTSDNHIINIQHSESYGLTAAEETILRATVIFSALILIFTLICGIMPTKNDAEIYGKILRLHVIADSDSEEDQALKLEVRDSVLETLGSKLGDCKNREEAVRVARSEQDNVKAAAEKTLRSLGCENSINITLGTEYYPTREYEGAHLPAGEYTSMRVVIGSGSGKNWWCVLFPAMCTNAAAEPAEEFIDAGFTPGQVKILTDTDEPKYVLKFKILEVFGELFERFRADGTK